MGLIDRDKTEKLFKNRKDLPSPSLKDEAINPSLKDEDRNVSSSIVLEEISEPP